MEMIETDNLLTWLSRSGYVWTYILNPLKLSNLTFSQKAGGGTCVRTFLLLVCVPLFCSDLYRKVWYFCNAWGWYFHLRPNINVPKYNLNQPDDAEHHWFSILCLKTANFSDLQCWSVNTKSQILGRFLLSYSIEKSPPYSKMKMLRKFCGFPCSNPILTSYRKIGNKNPRTRVRISN